MILIFAIPIFIPFSLGDVHFKLDFCFRKYSTLCGLDARNFNYYTLTIQCSGGGSECGGVEAVSVEGWRQ